jgi:hypothetical protein
MKKILAIVLILTSVGITQAQDRLYYTPVINKKELKHQPKIRKGILHDQLTKSEASRLRAEYRQVRKTELKAKADAKATNRSRAKQDRRQDRQSWSAYKQNHNRYGRLKVNKTHQS